MTRTRWFLRPAFHWSLVANLVLLTVLIASLSTTAGQSMIVYP